MLGGLTPAKSAPVINNGSPTILGKRSYEQHNGVDGECPLGSQAGPACSAGAACRLWAALPRPRLAFTC